MTTPPLNNESPMPLGSDVWSEERANLAQITEDIDRELVNINENSPATAAYQATAEAFKKMPIIGA